MMMIFMMGFWSSIEYLRFGYISSTMIRIKMAVMIGLSCVCENH